MKPVSNNPLDAFTRLTIKIGSALLVDDATGKLREDWLDGLAADIAGLRKAGKTVVVVSSGAIALGRRILGIGSGALNLEQSQAAASVGQIALSGAWANALARQELVAGQILITPNITEERRYFLNARTTIRTLLASGAVPIINENDSVATAEIRYGDNDRLSARVAAMIESDCLVLLSDVDGLYTDLPGSEGARHLPFVKKITPEITEMAGGTISPTARGGMVTKLEAGRIATQSGAAMIIARGTETNPLAALQVGARHTLFAPVTGPAAARKRWILGALDVAGRIRVDEGAARALRTGKSLLPVGVTDIEGDFSRGDTVSIVGADGEELARGLAGYDSEDARQVRGKKSGAVLALFGHGSRAELIHADNLVLTGVVEESSHE